MYILTLSLSVIELPQFHLAFTTSNQRDQWQRALRDLNAIEPPTPFRSPQYEEKLNQNSDFEDDDFRTMKTTRRVSSVNSGYSGTHGAPEVTSNAANAACGPGSLQTQWRDEQ